MAEKKKFFLITIDTEGDNLWAVTDIHQAVTTHNARFLFRFQELCEKYQFIPTYLTNYEMANDSAMIELGREGGKKGTLEIGAHEHAWNSPPYYHLVSRIGRCGKPYLSEYPRYIIRNKLEYLTYTLEDTFQCSITSHRGGRWCLNKTTVAELGRLGYLVDCTCTPGISWKNTPGWSVGARGTDWSKFPDREFYFRYQTEQDSKLLELPVTISDIRGVGHYSWLRPSLYNLIEMKELLKYNNEHGHSYAEFMLHSSELMPGGSPIFTNKGKIEWLYKEMEEIFEYARALGYKGMSVSDYASRIRNHSDLNRK